MSSKPKGKALFFILMIFILNALPPIYACGPCTQPHPPRSPYHRPGHPKKPQRNPHPPHHGGGHPKVSPHLPPVIVPPIIITPPLLPPPVIYPPPTSPYPPPYGGGPPSGGGGGVPVFPPPQPTCPIDALKLGLCLDVLGGLVHVGIGNPIENVCCPVIQGLLELEAAICLCTVIRIKLLNLNIFIPLALQVLITCGKTPPPGFVCPPL